MTALASLSLTNNAAVAVVFAPVGRDAVGVTKWMTTDTTIFDGKRVVTMSVTLPKNGSNVVRLKQRVMIPIMDTVDVTKKTAEAYVNIEFVMPKNSSDTVRLDLRKFADTLLTHAATTAAVQYFEDQY